MSNNLALAPVVDPRMFAFLQAQRHIQQPPQVTYPQQSQLQQAYSQQQPLQQPQGQQRRGGDADVASFLLQLKTNQNGEPVSDAEALQQLNAAAARSAQLQQQQQLPQVAPSPANGVIPGYSPMAAMNYYSHPGMVAFQQAASAANNFSKFYNPMQPHVPIQPQVPMHHQPYGLAPMAQPGGVAPGLNHAQPQLGAGMHGGPSGPPLESAPLMTDAYIESLITNDAVANKNKNPNGSERTTTKADSGSSNNNSESSSSPENEDAKIVISAKDDMDISLVIPKDRDLIPDSLFVALGQMKPVRLQQSDRVGCYKTRKIGFMGMACKHCGGQPGFGRYFPNSVRSLAQTTTSQTILKHIAGKCRFCPPHIRKAVLELQRQQAHKEHLTTGRPRYGSRKIFFQRMWARLHGPSDDGETAVVVEADVTPEIAKQEAYAAAKANEKRIIESSSKQLVTSGPMIKEPSPVSNNNTDDEGAVSLLPQKDEDSVLSFITKKRKLSEYTKEDDNQGNNNEEKKLRVSPVAV